MKNMLIVMKALKRNQKVEIGGATYVWMHEPTATTSPGLYAVAKSFSGPNQNPMDWESGTDIYFSAGHISIETFCQLCDELPESYLEELKAKAVW